MLFYGLLTKFSRKHPVQEIPNRVQKAEIAMGHLCFFKISSRLN
jgi:hypothetical protein